MEQSPWNAWIRHFLFCYHLYPQGIDYFYVVTDNLLFTYVEKSYKPFKMTKKDQNKQFDFT